MRTYEFRVNLVPTCRRIIPSTPAAKQTTGLMTPKTNADSMTTKSNADLKNAETNVEMGNECLGGALCNICDGDSDNDVDAFDSELFNLSQNEDGDDPLVGEDAGKEIQQEHLESILAAELVAEMAQKEEKMELFLYCNDLDTPPDWIKQLFSCILGDIVHAMNQASKVPVKHEYKQAYFVSLMKASHPTTAGNFPAVVG